MKRQPKAIALFFLLSLTALVMAYPADEDGNLIVPRPLVETCEIKGLVAGVTYLERDTHTEEEALEGLALSWNETWSKETEMEHASYVDMQRIIRDAYRTQNGEYIRDCCTEDVMKDKAIHEMELCIHYQGY